MTTGLSIDRTRTRRRLVALVNRIPDQDWQAGSDWYPNARDIVAGLASRSGHTPHHCAAVLAHLSPRTRWEQNVQGAWTLVTGGQLGTRWPRRERERARAALASDDPLGTLTGPKTAAFAANLTGDDDAVTLDGWMFRGLGVTLVEADRAGVYDLCASLVRSVAQRRGVAAATLQAAVWCYLRGTAE